MKQKQTDTKNRIKAWRGALALALAGAGAVMSPSVYADPPPPHGVIASQMGVEQIRNGNAAADIIVTNWIAVGDFRVRPTANRGDYDVQIGPSAADDVAGGVLIPSIAEHSRDQGTSSQLVGTAPNQVPGYGPGSHVATAHFEAQAAGSYFIPINYTLPNSISDSVIEFNMNIAAAWFPYDRYLGAYVRNATAVNGGPNDTLIGSPGIALGTHVIDLGSGRTTVNLTSMGINSKTDGVLLVVGAKNEDNYGLSQANDDGTWTIFSKDNGTEGTSTEQDPVAFTYIPKTAEHLISGKFAGDGSTLLSSGTAPAFTITALDTGTYELKVTGGGPDKGVLIISPEGGGALNRDNVVTYQANEARDGWIIESRDLPSGELPALETPGTEPVASFVYIPGSTPGYIVTPTTGLFTSEAGTTAAFTVALETRPKAEVTIAVSSSNTAEGNPDLTTLTFTPDNFNIPQTVTVTGADDTATDGPVNYSIVLAAAVSTDADYNGRDPLDVTISNIDNDGGITVNPTGGLVTTEPGGTATFTVRLSQAPTADVTIGLTSSDLTEGTVSPETLTFTSANWDQEQTVTITGADDFVDDADVNYTVVTAPAVSTDAFFNLRNAADVAVSNTDDDAAGVTVTPLTGLVATESGVSAFYTVILKSQPTADVSVETRSSDTTEGNALPAALTFTAENWNVEQFVEIKGVDDLIDDGTVSFSVTNKFTSTDPLYVAVEPVIVAAVNQDDEAAISLGNSVAIWGVGMPAIGIAGRASIVDPNTANYAGATLRVTFSSGGTADDRIEIRSTGTGEGQISVAGSVVSFSGAEIGTFTGGEGATALAVTLNGGASPLAAEALLRAITFRSVGESPVHGLRTVTVTLTDAANAVSSASTTVRVGLMRVTEFQEGADYGYGVYTGARDIELNRGAPGQAFPTGRNANGLYIEANTASAGQALLRFDNLIGTGLNQIPAGSIIVAAELYLDINESGAGSPFHRMLVTWDAETATWDSFTDGITPDDVEARTTFESQIGVSSGVGATTVGTVWLSVTPDVAAWVTAGEPNYGWVIPSFAPTTANSLSFSPSEAANVADRPRLRVSWLPPASVSSASFRQGVDEYTGTQDTRIRENAPDTDYSTATSVFVDALVSDNDPRPMVEYVLIRFNDIFGNGAGQIPAGSRIDAAVLDLASLGDNAVGDGGKFYALLQEWPESPVSWNSWVDGIQTNGVEAAGTPSAVVGNPTLNPDAQAGYLSFELTPDVQAWSSGTRPNGGWVIIPWPQGNNGWAVRMSEIGTERDRPRLRVYYTAAAGPGEIRILTTAYMASGPQITFTGVASTTFSIYRAETIDGTFAKIGTGTFSAQGAGEFTDTTAPVGQAFYRVGSP